MIAGLSLVPHRFRPMILRMAGATVGRGVLIYGGFSASGSSEIVIEDDVFINHRCFIDAQAPVILRSGARIGDHVRLITSTHAIGPSDRRAGAGQSRPIQVGRGAWVGSGACILPGVTIARGCVIAAGSVVTRSTEANGLYAGVPARRLRTLPPSVAP